MQVEIAIEHIISQNNTLKKILANLERIARHKLNILLVGETGTGKELCAQAIHQISQRQSQPFVPFNCGIGPNELFDSTVFGHVKGAFTNAISNRRGLIEESHQGILFLDEINSLDIRLQSKLNRFLVTGEFRRLGENKLRAVDVQIISATNIPLYTEVEKGNFREDLYYRIAEYVIELPPLRNRGGNIPLLMDYFLNKYKTQFHKINLEFAHETYQVAAKYQWPGNVRELQNYIKRCVLDAQQNIITPEIFSPGKSSSNNNTGTYFSLPLQSAKNLVVDNFEKKYLEHHLRTHQGNVEACARETGKHRSAFWALLKKHKIDPQVYRS